MTIKIGVTTVITNARSLINVVNGNYTGTVSAPSFVGSGIGLNGLTSGTNKKVYTTPGTFVVGTDCPSKVTNIKISCMGGGGNGGASSGNSGKGRGGGGASVLGITTQSVSNGQSYSITVGGAAGISSVTLPSASPIDVILVPGGVTAPGPATGVGAGGAAAPTSPLGADYVLVGYDGGRGQPGDFFGANYPYYFANGGDSVLGVGGPIAGGVGLPATGYGAGGGGASPTNPSNNAGGAGAPGIVIIEW
jgi:hypothetical protein